jgi:uncharacterized membrane protein
MSNELTPRSRVRDWPKGWLQDQGFWKDITTRTIAGTIAGVLVVLIGYAYAFLAGYISGPRWLDNIGTILALACVLSLTILIIPITRIYLKYRRPKRLVVFVVAIAFFYVLFIFNVVLDLGLTYGWFGR